MKVRTVRRELKTRLKAKRARKVRSGQYVGRITAAAAVVAGVVLWIGTTSNATRENWYEWALLISPGITMFIAACSFGKFIIDLTQDETPKKLNQQEAAATEKKGGGNIADLMVGNFVTLLIVMAICIGISSTAGGGFKHLGFLFLLYAIFVCWDRYMVKTLPEARKQVAEGIRRTSVVLNRPTLVTVVVAAALVWAHGPLFHGSALPPAPHIDQEAFIAGLVSFHLLFGAATFAASNSEWLWGRGRIH